MPRIRAGPLLALALLAACGLPASTTAHTAVPVLGSFESDRCVGVVFIAFLPYPVVQPHLPPGYTGYFIPLVAQTHLQVYTCEEVTIGSVTESNVTMAAVGTATLDGGAYRWETFIDEPSPNAIEGLLEDAGWPVHQATFTKTPAGVVVEGGGITYTLTTNPEQVGHPTRDDLFVRPIHHETAGGDHLQLDEVLNTGTVALYPGVLQAEGGVWEAIAGAPLVPVPGIVQEVDSVLAVDVHEAD